MYIHFDLYCNHEKQEKVYQKLRNKIQQWMAQGLVQRAVMTFHFLNGSLYVCLDISAVQESYKLKLTAEDMRHIPEEIINSIKKISEENNVKLDITNYTVEVQNAKKQSEIDCKPYYDNAPVNEILNFASIGTEIAFEVYQTIKDNKDVWTTDNELSTYTFF